MSKKVKKDVVIFPSKVEKDEYQVAIEIKEIIAYKDMDEGYRALYCSMLDKYIYLKSENERLELEEKELHSNLKRDERALFQGVFKNNEERNDLIHRVISLKGEHEKLHERMIANRNFQDSIFDILLENVRKFKIKER